ncbi:unnamed protein product, partial [Leptidea sinapis]
MGLSLPLRDNNATFITFKYPNPVELTDQSVKINMEPTHSLKRSPQGEEERESPWFSIFRHDAPVKYQKLFRRSPVMNVGVATLTAEMEKINACLSNIERSDYSDPDHSYAVFGTLQGRCQSDVVPVHPTGCAATTSGTDTVLISASRRARGNEAPVPVQQLPSRKTSAGGTDKGGGLYHNTVQPSY